MEQAFLTLITEHKALIYKVAHTFEKDAEARRDLFQEIVAQLWRAFPLYKGTAKWTTWAYRIALNVAINQQRKTKKNFIALVGDWTTYLERQTLQPVFDDAADEQLNALYAAIALLNPAEKALIMLYLDDIPYVDIASITGITENNVAVKLNRIKSKLKSILHHGK